MKKIIIICTLIAVAGMAICALFFLYSTHKQHQRKQVLSLIEKYYEQNDYTIARFLSLNILLENPDDEKAVEWIKKIQAVQKNNELLAKNSNPERDVENGVLYSLFAEIRKIKDVLANMEEKNGKQEIVYVTTKRDIAKQDKCCNEETYPEQDIKNVLANGIHAFDSEEYGKARYYFLKAVEIEDTNPQVNALLAASIYRENPQDIDNLSRALVYCKSAIEADKLNKLAWLTMGDIYRDRGNRELALTHYLEALNLDPHDGPLYNQVGILHYEMGEKEKAAFYFQKALKLEENLPLAYLYLGRIQMMKGRLKDAISFFKQAVSYDKNFFSAYADIGGCYFDEKNFGAALEAYDKAFILKHCLSVYVKKADCLMAMGLVSEAIKAYREAPGLYKVYTAGEKNDAALLYYERAFDAMKRGQYDIAHMFAETGISTGGKLIELNLLLANISKARGDYSQAEMYCQKALDLDKRYLEAFRELVLIYMEQGKKKQAVSTLALLRERVPSSVGTDFFKEMEMMINAM